MTPRARVPAPNQRPPSVNEPVRLGDVCYIQLGKMLSPASKRGPSPQPYLRNANVQWGRFDLSDVAAMDFTPKEQVKFALEPGDLLVCEGGEPGRSAVWEGAIEPCFYQKALHRIRPRDGRVDPYFLMFRLWYGSVTGEFSSSHRKSTIAHLPLERLSELRLALPPITDQRRIASLLRAAFSQADGARLAAQEQKEGADQLFSRTLASGFAGVTPMAAGVPEEPAPAGWRWIELKSVARLESGHTPSRRHPEWWSGDIPWIALPDIRALDGRTAFQTWETVNDQGIANSSARVLPTNTVVMSRTASVGFVTIMGRPMATSQDFVNWVCRPELDPFFLAYALRASRGYIRGLASGAVHKTIYMPTLESLRVCAPPIDEQRRIVAELDRRLGEVERLARGVEDRLNLISTLPAAILRAAFSKQESIELRRGAVASYLVDRLHDQPTFGRVMFQKLLYLTEAHAGVDLGCRYERRAAGPHSPRALREIETMAEERGWFSARKEDGRYVYTRGLNISERLAAAETLLGDGKAELDRLIAILGHRRTEVAEVVATLFAAWNDFLLDGQTPTDDEIVAELHTNWHERKRTFSAARLKQALDWMRDKNIVPVGRGPRTEKVNA